MLELNRALHKLKAVGISVQVTLNLAPDTFSRAEDQSLCSCSNCFDKIFHCIRISGMCCETTLVPVLSLPGHLHTAQPSVPDDPGDYLHLPGLRAAGSHTSQRHSVCLRRPEGVRYGKS